MPATIVEDGELGYPEEITYWVIGVDERVIDLLRHGNYRFTNEVKTVVVLQETAILIGELGNVT